MTVDPGSGLHNDSRLELDVGDEASGPIPRVPSGHLRALWSGFTGDFSKDTKLYRYLSGDLVLLLLIVGAAALLARERTSA
ncbi:MAG: hypothetical protein ABR564_04765 [Candidatus Dormibacteria bacterium]